MKSNISQLLACVVLAIVWGVAVEADPILWTGNGHYYELVEADGTTWDSAQSAAERRIYLGVSGHLATITSPSEQDFIAQNLLPGQTTRAIYLLGGIQRVDGAEPYGGWEWITGEPWGYTNWSWNNPNNDANQDVLAIYGNPSDGLGYTYWDDYWAHVGTHTGGYIVEYPVPDEGPKIRLEPMFGPLFFENVEVGKTPEMYFNICNDGTSELSVTAISYPFGFTGYTVTTPMKIAAGQKQMTHLIFKPTEAKTYSGDVIVTSNATSGTNTIACSGTGTPKKFKVVLSSTSGGSVESPGEGTFDCDGGTSVTLEAQANSGYHFTHWSGNLWSASNPLILTIDHDYDITANFEISEDWSFVHITDVHIGTDSGAAYLRGAVEEINKMNPLPAFVLVTGDIAQYAYNLLGEDAGFHKEYRQIMEHLDASIQTLDVPGNHDRYAYPSLTSTLNAYTTHLGESDSILYEHKSSGFVFIGMDSGEDKYAPADDLERRPYIIDLPSKGLSEQQINWLKDPQRVAAEPPKIIFMHHPAVDDKGWGISNRQEAFTEYCEKNNVQLVLTGHTHQNMTISAEGSAYPLYVQTPALKDGYYRVIRVEDGFAIPEAPSKIPDGKGTFMVTFDDGPFSLADGRTKKIVDALKNVNGKSVKAGFFMVGCNDDCEDTGAPKCCLPVLQLGCGWTLYEEGTKGSVHANPEVVRIVKEAGHTIGNHTQHHIALPNFACWDQNDVEKEITACEDELRIALGEEPAKFFRPPHLSDWPFVLAAADKLDYTIIGGELVYDWETDDVSVIKRNALRALREWSKPEPCILIFHDSGPATADNIREILEYLISQGYTLVDFDPHRSVGRLEPVSQDIRQQLASTP